MKVAVQNQAEELITLTHLLWIFKLPACWANLLQTKGTLANEILLICCQDINLEWDILFIV